MPQEQVLTSTETQDPPGGMTQDDIDRFNAGEVVETTETVETQQESTETTVDEPSAEDEEAVLARERGWVEKDRWHGKGEWREAKDFNRIYETRTVPKQLQTENRELRQQMATQAAELADMRKRFAEQDATREQIRLETLRSELTRAQEEQNWARVSELTDELLDHKVKAAAPKPQPQRAANPQEAAAKTALDAFAAANPIFSQDQRLGRVLTEQVAVIQAIANQAHQPMPPDELLDEAKDRVMRMYPEKFRPVKRPAMAEMNGSPGGTRGNGRQWSDLNTDAREALDRFIKDSPEHMKLGVEKARTRLLANADDSYFKRR